MPLHTDFNARIPYTYGNFPKNLMEESSTVDNKFLNNNQHIIEEIQYRQHGHFLPEWMKWYQNKTYGNSGILSKENFYKILHSKHRGYLIATRYIHTLRPHGTTSSPNGADLTSGAIQTAAQNYLGLLIANQANGGIVGKKYDQIALRLSNSFGSMRLGVYDDDAGSPNKANNLEASTGSIVCASGLVRQSITEFSLNTGTQWICHQLNSNGTILFRATAGAANSRQYRSFSYGTFPNPSGITTTNDNTASYMLIGHS